MAESQFQIVISGGRLPGGISGIDAVAEFGEGDGRYGFLRDIRRIGGFTALYFFFRGGAVGAFFLTASTMPSMISLAGE